MGFVTVLDICDRLSLSTAGTCNIRIGYGVRDCGEERDLTTDFVINDVQRWKEL